MPESAPRCAEASGQAGWSDAERARPGPPGGPKSPWAQAPTRARLRVRPDGPRAAQVTRQGTGYLRPWRRLPPTFFAGARPESKRRARARNTEGKQEEKRQPSVLQRLWQRCKTRARGSSGTRVPPCWPAAGPTAAGSCLTSGSYKRSAAAPTAAPRPSGAHAKLPATAATSRPPEGRVLQPAARACAALL